MNAAVIQQIHLEVFFSRNHIESSPKRTLHKETLPWWFERAWKNATSRNSKKVHLAKFPREGALESGALLYIVYHLFNIADGSCNLFMERIFCYVIKKISGILEGMAIWLGWCFLPHFNLCVLSPLQFLTFCPDKQREDYGQRKTEWQEGLISFTQGAFSCFSELLYYLITWYSFSTLNKTLAEFQISKLSPSSFQAVSCWITRNERLQIVSAEILRLVK